MTLKPPGLPNNPILQNDGVYSVLSFGVRGDGSTDDTAGIQRAFDAAAGATLWFPEATYRTTGVVRVPSNVTVQAHNATFRPSGQVNAVELGTVAARSPTTTYPLTADPAIGAFSVQVSTANAAVLSAGQRVQLRDPTYANNGVVCRRETNVIESVNAGTGAVTLRYPVGHAYTVANGSWIAPVTMTSKVRWLGGTFDMSAVAGGIPTDCDAIAGIFVEDCVVADVTVHHHPSKGVAFYGGLNSRIVDCNAYTPSRAGPGEGYVAQLEYCRECRIVGGWSYNVRHHADIVGGQSNGIIGGQSAGRPVGVGADFNTGAMLHGLESRWCFVQGFSAQNMTNGAFAGNGTFSGDYDFTFADVRAKDCDNGVVAYKSTGQIVRPYVRGATVRGVDVTNDGCEVDVIDADIDMGAVNLQAIGSAGMTATTKLRVRGGTIRSNHASVEPIKASAPAGAQILIEGVTFVGTALRGVYLTGASTDQAVRGCKFIGTVAEAVRIEAGEASVFGCMFGAGVTTGVRAAVSAVKVTHGANSWGSLANRTANTSTGVVVGSSRLETEGTAAPTTGAWQAGDRCWNSAPAAGGVPGWVCTTAGTPGTWKAMGNLAA